jgi:hypothetical protein
MPAMHKAHWHPVSFAAAAAAAPPQIDFCLPNFMAGTVGVVAAPAGIGKTSLLMQLGAAVAAGIAVAGDLLPAPAVAGKVVFLATEDPAPVLQRRAHFFVRSLRAQGLGDEVVARLESNFQFLSIAGTPPKILGDASIGTHSLDELQALAYGSRLLILDPIRRFHTCDEQNFGKMLLLFDLLADMAAQTGCAILFSHHVEQALHADALREIEGAQGSSAFINATRWVVNMNGMSSEDAQRFGITPQQRREHVRVAFTKSNYGSPVPPRWLKRSEHFEGIFETCDPVALPHPK